MFDKIMTTIAEKEFKIWVTKENGYRSLRATKGEHLGKIFIKFEIWYDEEDNWYSETATLQDENYHGFETEQRGVNEDNLLWH